VALREATLPEGGAHALRTAKLPAGVSGINANLLCKDLPVAIADALSQDQDQQRTIALLSPAALIDIR
jgi:hypothetical protein